jgi:hypothetical protein
MGPPELTQRVLYDDISDAFRDAELLARAVDRGLSGSQPLEEALAEYPRERTRAGMPSFELNFRFATLEPPHPEMQALFGALRGNQPETDRFIGRSSGPCRSAEFYEEPDCFLIEKPDVFEIECEGAGLCCLARGPRRG